MLQLSKEQLFAITENLVVDSSIEWVLEYKYKGCDFERIYTRLQNYVIRKKDEYLIICDPNNEGHAVYLIDANLESFVMFSRNSFIESIRTGTFLRHFDK